MLLTLREMFSPEVNDHDALAISKASRRPLIKAAYAVLLSPEQGPRWAGWKVLALDSHGQEALKSGV